MALTLIISLASCSAAESMDKEVYYEEVTNGYAGDSKLDIDLENSQNNADGEYERKIIKTANISTETKSFDEALTLVEQLCENTGGYIESSTVRGVSLNHGSGYRYASYTIRIPAENFDGFTEGIGGILNVVSSSSNADEVTATYYDIKSRIEVLQMQKSSLQELYQKYTDYGDIGYLIEIQDKLYDVIAEIEAYETQIRLYDDRVSYSTVNLSVSEVVTYTENQNEKTFGDKIADAFSSGWKVFVSICQGIAIAFVAAFPTLAALAIIACAIVFICLAIRKRNTKKKIAENTSENSENKK
jgi:hypothetical protein